jgi:ribosome-binding protein aMBF1 (putative translation factor)
MKRRTFVQVSEREFRRIQRERERLGRRLQELRESKGLSRRKLAKRVGMSVPNLWRIEVRGQNSPALPELFRALGSRLDAHTNTPGA